MSDSVDVTVQGARPGWNGGTLQSGRSKSKVVAAIRRARSELDASIDVLTKIRDGSDGQMHSDDARIKAALALFTISRLGEQKPKHKAAGGFSVARRSRAEMQTSAAEEPTPSPAPADPDPSPT